MPAIALVDDRRNQRETAALLIRRRLPEGWQVLDHDPLPTLDQYLPWIAEEEIKAIVLDERLHEEVNLQPADVGYDGHDVVEFLRAHMPSFPIFVLTSFPRDDDIQARFGKVEEIIDRREFASRADAYTERMVRSAVRFTEEFEGELSRLGELAATIAQGSASAAEVQEAEAIRTKLSIAFPMKPLTDRDAWLKELEGTIGALEKIVNEAEGDAVDKDR